MLRVIGLRPKHRPAHELSLPGCDECCNHRPQMLTNMTFHLFFPRTGTWESLGGIIQSDAFCWGKPPLSPQNLKHHSAFCFDIGVWCSAGMTSSATVLDCHDVEVLRTSSSHSLDDTGIHKPRVVICRPRDIPCRSPTCPRSGPRQFFEAPKPELTRSGFSL